MLQLKKIEKEYNINKKESIKVLHDIDIEFREKEFVSILGPSGCGKTTLLNIIGGLDKATAGDIIIEGKKIKDFDALELDTYRSKSIGFIFQSYNLIPTMNILQNVELALTIAGVAKSERKKRAQEALELVGLKNHLRKKPTQMSGGQMQRVAIARALVNEPNIILADEPTGALDSESGIQVMDILKKISEKKLVLMVTHNPELAEKYSDRIINLKDGAIVSDTKPYDSQKDGKQFVDISYSALTLMRGDLKHGLYKARKKIMKKHGISEYLFSDIQQLRENEIPERCVGKEHLIEKLKEKAEKNKSAIDKIIEIEKVISKANTVSLSEVNEIKYDYILKDKVKDRLGFKQNTDINTTRENVEKLLKKIRRKMCSDNFMREDVVNDMLKLRNLSKDRKIDQGSELANKTRTNRELLDSITQLDEVIRLVPNASEKDLKRIVGQYGTQGYQFQTAVGRWVQKQVSSDHSSMDRRTTFKLSANSLKEKKNRTITTTFAGSIGIVGVILVLGISFGIKSYIRKTEEASLAKYPIEIQREGVDVNRMLELVKKAAEADKTKKWPKTKRVQINKLVSSILGDSLTKMSANSNDLAFAKKELEKHFRENSKDGFVKSEYGTNFSVFGENKEGKLTKVHPYTDVMESYLDKLHLPDDIKARAKANSQQMVEGWTESPSTELLKTQYEKIAGEWFSDNPETGYREVMLRTDERNRIPDYVLCQLGLLDGTDLLNKDSIMKELPSNIIGREYNLVPRYNYFEKDSSGTFNELEEKYFDKQDDSDTIEKINQRIKNKTLRDKNGNEIKLKIVGIIRPKKNTEATLLSGNVIYSSKLNEYIIRRGLDTEVVKAQANALADFSSPNFTLKVNFTDRTLERMGFDSKLIKEGKFREGATIPNEAKKDTTYEKVMRELGAADLNNPKSLKLYFSSYDAKERGKKKIAEIRQMNLREHIRNPITKFIDKLGDENPEKKAEIVYIDFLEVIMGYVRQMAKIIIYTLVSFSSISLIVSTIMISIIVYTSVLERKKEIGVLRSLGARKKDVSRLFTAESFMLGAISGAMGVLFSLIISGIANLVLKYVYEQPRLVGITWYHCLIMFGLSILLSVIAGFIPAQLAAKQDPAVTLRTQ